MIKGTWLRLAFFLAVLLLLVSFTFMLPAQPGGRYLVKRYSIENGLPQSSVTGLALDRNGFLWLATHAGLCRFDGRRFNNYTSNNSILSENRIAGLAINAKGRILAMVQKMQLYVFYVDEHYQLQKDRAFDRPNFIFVMGRNPIICDSSLACVNASGLKRIFALQRMDFIKERNVYPVNGQQLYIYKNDSLFWVDVRLKQFRHCGIVLHAITIVNDQLLAFNDHGQPIVWNGQEQVSGIQVTHDFSLLRERLQQHQGTRIASFQNIGGSIGLIRVQNEIWGISLHNGLLDAALLYSDLDEKLHVSSLCYDERNKLLFIGTETEGVYVVQQSLFNTILFDKRSSLGNCIYNLLCVGSHSVADMNFQYDMVQKTSCRLPVTITSKALLQSSDGRIWYTNGDSLYVADSNWVTLKRLPFIKGLTKAFLEDEDHTIWAAGDDKALYCIRGDSLQRIVLASLFLSTNDFTTLFSFDRERIWLGTTGGIQVYNKRIGNMEGRFLEGQNIRSIYRARDGGIWVSTYGNGIYRYLTGKWIPLPLDAGKRLLFAHYFVEDDNGFFWIPTNNGLLQCKKQALEAYARHPGKMAVYYYLYRKVGAYTDEFNGGFGNGSIWYHNLLLLPSMEGVLCFAPLAIQPLLPNKEILIESVSINSKIIYAWNNFRLPPGNQRLEITVVAPYFGDEHNIVLEYQLKEISRQWIMLREGIISYNTLPKGNYHLTIRKRIGFGPGDYAYKTIQFTIRPFWYETLWFKLVDIGSLLVILYLLYRWRVRSLQGTKLQLERKVAERTTDLNAAIDDLNLSEQRLSQVNGVQEQALAIILHDIRSPLKYLALGALHFSRNIQQLSMDELIQYSKSLALTTDSIDKFSNDLVQWLIFNRDNQKLNNEMINLPELLGQIKNLYEEIVALNGNIIVVEKGMDVLVADRDKLYLVIRNLVDNAAKHCQHGRITLSARSGSDEIVITVADTGKGMSKQELLWWRQYETTLPDFKKEKLGLSMVYYFVQLMNGKLQIDSIHGAGTTVTITLPALAPSTV